MGIFGKGILDSVSDVQRAAYNSGLVEGRKQGEATNAKLLEAAKRAYSVFQAEKEGGGYYDPTAYLILEDAICESEEATP